MSNATTCHYGINFNEVSRHSKRQFNLAYTVSIMKVEKEKFDTLLQRLLKQKPEKTATIKGESPKHGPIIPKPQPSEPR